MKRSVVITYWLLSGSILLCGFYAPAFAEPPVVSIRSLALPAEVEEGEAITAAAFVEASDGSPVLLSWDFGDGSLPEVTVDDGTLNHRFDDDGTYTVQVTAEAVGGSASRSATVTVTPVAPQIEVLAQLQAAVAGEAVSFEAVAHDPGDEDLIYRWDFGDGSGGREGRNLASLSHTYPRDGAFPLTLTVADDDGLEASRRLLVTVGTFFELEVRGSVTKTLRGEPQQVAVCPLGEESCGLQIWLWDEGEQDFFHLTLAAGDLTRNAAYPLRNPNFLDRVAPAGGGLKEVDWTVGLLGLSYPPPLASILAQGLMPVHCEMSEPGQGSASAGALGALGNLYGKILAEAMGGGSPEDLAEIARLRDAVDSGDQRMFQSASGSITVERFSQRRIQGRIEGVMVDDPDEPGERVTVSGRFALDLDDGNRRRLEACGAEPFHVVERSPEADEEHVDFDRPQLWVQLSQPFDAASVTGDSVILETQNEAGEYWPVPVRRIPDPSRGRIYLEPQLELDSARWYRLRVLGGESGVRGASGEVLAADDVGRFATVPDLYRPAPENAAAVARARQFRAVTRIASMQAPIPLDSDPSQGGRTLQEADLKIVPEVNCRVYQVAHFKPLVRGKATLFRVYASWKQPQYASPGTNVGRFKAKVWLEKPDGKLLLPAIEGFTFKHPDFWKGKKLETFQAQHTANFFGWKADPGVRSVIAKVAIPQKGGKARVYSGHCALEHWDVAEPELTISAYVLPADDWEDLATVKKEWKTIRSRFAQGMEYLQQQFPVRRVDWTLKLAVEDFDEETEYPAKDVVELPTFSEPYRAFLPYKATPQTRIMYRLQEAVKKDRADLILGLHPRDWASGSEDGVSYSGENFHRPLVRAALQTEGVVYAHETGHAFGLEHYPKLPDCDSTEDPVPGEPNLIQGFRLAVDGSGGWNKSTVEGNGQSVNDPSKIRPLMHPCAGTRSLMWITNTQYYRLQLKLKQLFQKKGK